jgi:tol-pal system protein YbgF
MRKLALPTRIFIVTAGLALAGAVDPVYAFADDEARRAILDLRQQLQQQSEQNQRARLQLADQIQTLQQEVAQLRDQLELASRQPVSPTLAAAQTPNAPADTSTNDPQEQATYDRGLDQFRKGQYKEAAETLAAFVTRYPSSPLTATAQFYLGSSYYALKDFKNAIQRLSAMVQDSPSHPRASDALLVIAGSQVELNNRAGAKTTLERIVRDYAGTPAANTAKNRLQLL